RSAVARVDKELATTCRELTTWRRDSRRLVKSTRDRLLAPADPCTSRRRCFYSCCRPSDNAAATVFEQQPIVLQARPTTLERLPNCLEGLPNQIDGDPTRILSTRFGLQRPRAILERPTHTKVLHKRRHGRPFQ